MSTRAGSAARRAAASTPTTEGRLAGPAGAHLALAGTISVWSVAFVAIKALLDHGLSPADVAIGRYAIAAPGFVALLFVYPLRGVRRGDWVRIVLLAALLVPLYHLPLNRGEQSTTAGTTSLLVATVPAITLALALALRTEAFSGLRLLGIAVAFGGVAVVTVLGAGQRVGASSLRGPLLVLVAAVAVAVFNVVGKPLLDRHGAIAIMAVENLIGGAMLLPAGGRETLHRATHLQGRDLALLGFLGVFPTLLGYLGFAVGLRRLDASRATTYLYASPPLAVATGALLLGEPVTVWLALGGVLVLGGVALAQQPKLARWS